MKLIHSEGEEHGVILTSKEIELIRIVVGHLNIPAAYTLGYDNELDSIWEVVARLCPTNKNIIVQGDNIYLEQRESK